MPQLIAMTIVVVGAMIYMFNSFGGTGNKITSIAQKPSVLTEISSIKSGINLALAGGEIKKGTTLRDLAKLGYFEKAINEQLLKDDSSFQNKLISTGYAYLGNTSFYRNGTISENFYSALSFGGRKKSSMLISLVTNLNGTDSKSTGLIPGLRIQFLNDLDENGGFLERQISNDLKNLAIIDNRTVDGYYPLSLENGEISYFDTILHPPKGHKHYDRNKKKYVLSNADGIFTIYFKDYAEKMK